MVNIKVYNDIDSQGNTGIFAHTGGQPQVFSAELVKQIFENNPTETDFRFNIHCNGGSVTEGFVIYDLLRTSGKNIHTNIEGGCHSMAIILLLAAPRQNRTANPNATAIIHDVRGYAEGYLSAGEAQALATDLEAERDRILNVYTERTGCSRQQLKQIMLEEKRRTVNDLLQWGFISKINHYTTNLNQNQMTKKREPWYNKVANFLRGEVVNYEFLDDDGKALFITEKDDDSLEVGDTASPDGTFNLPDGRTVVISGGVITEIIVPETVEELQNKVAQLQKQLAVANAKREKAVNLLKEAHNQVIKANSALAGIRSVKNIAPRQSSPVSKATIKLTTEELKNQIRTNLGKA